MSRSVTALLSRHDPRGLQEESKEDGRSTERGSSSSARRRGACRQDQLRVVGDVAHIAVVADETDLVILPLQPHQVAGVHGLRILENRDHLAAIEPGGGEPYRGAL